MRKVSLVLAIIAVLSLAVVGACGGDNGETETPTQPTVTIGVPTATAEQTTTTSEASEPSGGDGDLTWNDMPVYGGADHIEEFTMSFAPDESEYSEFEWRYYETGDDVGGVIDFYRDEMPDNGWEEMMWMDMGEIAYGMYTKNSENDAAMVWISGEEGETVIGLWRAAK